MPDRTQPSDTPGAAPGESSPEGGAAATGSFRIARMRVRRRERRVEFVTEGLPVEGPMDVTVVLVRERRPDHETGRRVPDAEPADGPPFRDRSPNLPGRLQPVEGSDEARAVIALSDSAVLQFCNPGQNIHVEVRVANADPTVYRGGPIKVDENSIPEPSSDLTTLQQASRVSFGQRPRHQIQKVFLGNPLIRGSRVVDLIGELGLRPDGSSRIVMGESKWLSTTSSPEYRNPVLVVNPQARFYNSARFQIRTGDQVTFDGQLEVWVMRWTWIFGALAVLVIVAYLAMASLPFPLELEDDIVEVRVGETVVGFDPLENDTITGPVTIDIAESDLISFDPSAAPSPSGDGSTLFDVTAKPGAAANLSPGDVFQTHVIPYTVQHQFAFVNDRANIRVRVLPELRLEPAAGEVISMDRGESIEVDYLIDRSLVRGVSPGDVIVEIEQPTGLLRVEQVSNDTIRVTAPTSSAALSFNYRLAVRTPTVTAETDWTPVEVCVANDVACTIAVTARDDQVTVPTADAPFYVPVLANDDFPNRRPDDVTIVQRPRRAVARLAREGIELDAITASGGETDVLSYEITADGRRSRATVEITYVAPSVVARDDGVVAVDVGGASIDVLANDDVGSGSATLTVDRPPTAATASVQGNEIVLSGITGAPGTTDSLVYRLSTPQGSDTAEVTVRYVGTPPRPSRGSGIAVRDDRFDPVPPDGGSFDVLANDGVQRGPGVAVTVDPTSDATVETRDGLLVITGIRVPPGNEVAVRYTVTDGSESGSAVATFVVGDPCLAVGPQTNAETRLLYVPAGAFALRPAAAYGQPVATLIAEMLASGLDIGERGDRNMLRLPDGLCVQERELTLGQETYLKNGAEVFRRADQAGLPLEKRLDGLTVREATDLTRRLAAETGRPYRLPSAREWAAALIHAEVVGRAGLLLSMRDDLLEYLAPDAGAGTTAVAVGGTGADKVRSVAPDEELSNGGARAVYTAK